MAAPTLTCKQCGHVNEGERVYCHNCGAKLDRSLLPPKETTPQESAAKAKRRVKKITDPSRGFWVGWKKSLLGAIIGAIVLAALIQMARKPDGVPPMLSKADLIGAPPLADGLEQALSLRAPQHLSIAEPQINHYLQVSVKSGINTALNELLRFDRAFVNLSEGVCRITIQDSIYDYPIYIGTEYHLAAGPKGIVATNVGGNFGRLHLPPQISQLTDAIFEKLWDALKREHRLMDGMQSIEVHPGAITIETKPGVAK